MAALLIGMAVMAILMSVAMPTWNQMVRREKEEELIFRGNQYARAINFYQRKFANASPSNLDILVEQHLLRKKFRDPMSTEKSGEFQLLYLSNSPPSNRPGDSTQPGTTGSPGSTGSALSTRSTGLIAGVASKNTGESIRIYDGKTHYNEWQFVGMQQSSRAGGGGTGGGPAGGRGGAPGGPPGTGPPGSGRQGGGSTFAPSGDGRGVRPPPDRGR
jgi:type II secretory pathway pseudopilin PulG